MCLFFCEREKVCEASVAALTCESEAEIRGLRCGASTLAPSTLHWRLCCCCCCAVTALLNLQYAVKCGTVFSAATRRLRAAHSSPRALIKSATLAVCRRRLRLRLRRHICTTEGDAHTASEAECRVWLAPPRASRCSPAGVVRAHAPRSRVPPPARARARRKCTGKPART